MRRLSGPMSGYPLNRLFPLAAVAMMASTSVAVAQPYPTNIAIGEPAGIEPGAMSRAMTYDTPGNSFALARVQDNDSVVELYAVTAASRGTTGATSDRRLEALLGSQRARLLRRLDRPRTYSELADSVGIAISTTSHHVDRLRASGLVVTMRLGRAHWVLRTAVGDRLLELLD